MSQQLIEDYIGYTYKQKVIDDIHKIVLESKKFLDPIALAECCLITIHDKGEIKSLGASVPSDLIMDNFGELLKVLSYQIITGANETQALTDITNSAISVFLRDMNAGQSGFTFLNTASASRSFGVRLQVGSSGTTPTRQDFNIGTPFGTSPEDTPFNTNVAGYNSGNGQITFGNNITAGGAGTVAEAIAQLFIIDTSAVAKVVMIFRDLISPSLAFIAGQTIAVDWVIQI